jgi:uncharacterized DUF497 family protein
MKISFDQAKRDRVFAEQGLAFEDAALVSSARPSRSRTAGPRPAKLEERRGVAYGETRYQTVGFLLGRMVMVVWTPRGAARHVISMRKCNAREKAIYQNRFEEG